MKQNGLWVIAFVIVALMVLTSVSPLSMNRTETIDNSTYIISNTPPDNPELGDLWFDTTLDEMNIYNGYVWQNLVPTVSGAGYSDHAAKHYWGGVDPIEFHKLSPQVRIAAEFAESGSGTGSDPYKSSDGTGGIQAAIDDIPSPTVEGEGGTVFVNGVFNISSTINLKHNINLLGFGKGGGSVLQAEGEVNMISTSESPYCASNMIAGLTFNGGGLAGIQKAIYTPAGVRWDEITIRDCFFYCLDNAIQALGGIEECLIVHNYIDGTSPIYITSSTNYFGGIISDNIIWAGSRIFILNSNAPLIIQNNQIIAINKEAIKIQTCSNIQIKDNFIDEVSRGSANSYDGILVTNCADSNIVIDGNTIDNKGCWGGATDMRYAIFIDAASSGVKVLNNVLDAGTSGTIYDDASDTYYRNNVGYTTEKSNSTTILNGGTHVTVTHEMDITPTSITVTGNHSEVSACWIVNITSTQFEIWVSAAVTYDRVVYWYAEAR